MVWRTPMYPLHRFTYCEHFTVFILSLAYKYSFDVSGSYHKKPVTMATSGEGTEWVQGRKEWAGEEGFLFYALLNFWILYYIQKR